MILLGAVKRKLPQVFANSLEAVRGWFNMAVVRSACLEIRWKAAVAVGSKLVGFECFFVWSPNWTV